MPHVEHAKFLITRHGDFIDLLLIYSLYAPHHRSAVPLWEKIVSPPGHRIQPVEQYCSAVSHCLDKQQASSSQHGAPILRTGL